jgi:hypothetical protein
MTEVTTDEKRFLNYQGASFKRSLYYLIGACVTYSACVLIKFKPSIPPPGAVAGPPLPQIFLGMASFSFALFAILDVFFVLYQNFLRTKQFAFDPENFYIIRKDSTELIPLKNIFQIALATSAVSKNSVRGYSDYYRISYKNDGEEKDILITIYSRMEENFNDFRKFVKEKNPSVEIKNWSTSLYWIFRMFKKRKSRDTGDLFK